ncbi:MAG TPA: DUF916 domain-containing protein [Actinocrinis sp.]|nr:DUF916 domain-containing protein [Actinocrinis sp.]
MARPRSILTFLAAVAMTSALFTGSAWAAPTSPAGPAAPATAQSGDPSGLSPSADGTASGNATFGIQPATAKGVDGRSTISYAANGGSQETDHIAVTNYSSDPLSLHVYATDAYNTADGGFSVLPSTQKPTDLGLWITLAQTFLTIPAKSTAIIPFTLKVPANAAPGDHAGGIVASLTTMTHDAKGNQVAVESRVGTRVAVRVPGALHAQLSVTKVSAVYHGTLNPFGGGSATVSYVVTNTGNIRLTGTQDVRVSSMVGGSEPGTPIAAIKELLPGDSMRVTTEVYGVTPSFSATARVSVTPAGYPGDIDPAFTTVVQSASMVAIPWPLIILILLLAAGAYLFWRRRRIRKLLAAGGNTDGRGRPGGGSTPGGGPTSKAPGGPARTGPKTTAPKPSTSTTAKPRATVPAPKAGAGSRTTVPAPKAKASAATANQNPKPVRP